MANAARLAPTLFLPLSRIIPRCPVSAGKEPGRGWLNEVRGFALVLLCLTLYAPGLTSIPPVDRDEARLAQATRQMLETGDFVQIRFQHEARNKKPIGIHWLQAASVALFSAPSSTAIWPYRLPSALAATVAVLLTSVRRCPPVFARRRLCCRIVSAGGSRVTLTLYVWSGAEMAPIPGRLFGLGVGLGDPELLTFKATAAVARGSCRRLSDARAWQQLCPFDRTILLEAGQRKIAIRTPMQPGPPPDAIYHAAAAKLVTEFDHGNDASIQLKSSIFLWR